ncbi:MAG TPA: hypothetical protein DDY13_08915 [Cytophagales bacterium]|jgi:glycosyltransferase involved in cell wall biosynthesis|nr:hypothetical protein [Cytophagales bacterium]
MTSNTKVNHNSTKVSLILPVYNTAPFLDRALRTAVNQTLHDIEIIVVNDGSTDNSIEIIRTYAEKDSRIFLIDKENEGVGVARNIGAQKAKGEYILFFDSDDYIELNMAEKLFEVAKRGDHDLVCCNILIEDTTGNDLGIFKVRYRGELSGGLEAMRSFLEGKLFRPAPYNKLFKHSLFTNNDLNFAVGIHYEDNPFTLKLVGAAKKIKMVPFNLYHYVRHDASATRTISKKHLEDTAKLNGFIYDYLKNNDLLDELNDAYEVFCLRKWQYSLKMVMATNPKKENFQLYKEFVPDKYLRNFSPRYKLLLRIGQIWPSLPRFFTSKP